MIVSECLQIKLSHILQSDDRIYLEEEEDNKLDSNIKAENEWNASIVSIQKLLDATIDTERLDNSHKQGIIISSPTPIINDIHLVSQLETVVFCPSQKTKMALMPCGENSTNHSISQSSFINIPFDNQDVLQEEQFSLILSDKFACAIVKTADDKFYFSFTPEVIKKAWYLLQARLIINNCPEHDYIQELVEKFTPYIPSYQIISRFTRYLLIALKQQELSNNYTAQSQSITQPQNSSISLKKTPLPPYPELEFITSLNS